MRRSLAYTIAAGTALVTALFVLVLLYLSEQAMERVVRRQVAQLLADTADELQHTALDKLSKLRDDLARLAGNTLIANALVDDVGRELYLRSFLQGYRVVDDIPLAVIVTNYRGAAIADNRPDWPKPRQLTEWAAAVVADNRPAVRLVRVDGADYALFGAPVIYANTGTAEGALLFQIRLADLTGSKEMRRHWIYSGRIEGIDLTLHDLTDGTVATLSEQRPRRPAATPAAGETAFAGLAVRAHLHGEPQLLEREVAALRNDYLLLALLGLLAAALAGGLLARLLSRRIARLAADTRRLIRADEPVARLQVEGSDEVAQLASAFNTALDQLELAQNDARAHAEHALALQRDKYRGVVDRAGEALLIFDAEGGIREANAAAAKLLGYRPERLERLGFADLFDAADQNPTPPTAPTTFETELRAADGSPLAVEVNAGRLTIDDRPHLLWLLRDVGERRAMQRALIGAKEEAERASRAKSAFLATMSHEIRTPMNAILGVADLLAETPLDEEQEHYVAMFASAGENLLQIINDILDISKIEAGQVELERRPFSLARNAADAVEIVRGRAHGKGLKLITFGFEALPERVVGDPVRLRQVLINLLGNAVKFTERGCVALLADGSPLGEERWRLTFYVVDTGIGISAEQRERVFQEFTQADSTITRRFGGTGLGLAICRRLAGLMGGSLSLHSREGHGTTFRFTVELEGSSEGDAEGPAEALTGRHILTLHDHPIHRDFYESSLAAWGAEVTPVEQPQGFARRCLEEWARRPFDLLFIHHERLDRGALLDELRALRAAPELTGLSIILCGTLHGRDELAPLHALDVVFLPDRHDDQLLARGMRLALNREARHRERRTVDPATTAGMRVLLADDSTDNVELFRAFVARQGIELVVAGDGEEAVGHYLEYDGAFDLVLMDIEMPRKDGYGATREIRQWERFHRRPRRPILALTAHALEEHVALSREAGCDEHLAKPLKKQALLEALARYAPPKR
ncbi:hybrid sensor histidine kinase/response regulator [Endothiovibrio diazotrophicus]